MYSKLHRCGYCGHPTDAKGEPLQNDAFTKAVNIIETYGDGPHTQLEHGNCCLPGIMMEQEQEERYRVTADMASDAGDPSLEGTLY